VIINYFTINKVKCDCCGKITVRGKQIDDEWFGKYLKPNEERICHACIRDRKGYKEEFLEQIGVSLDTYERECLGDKQ